MTRQRLLSCCSSQTHNTKKVSCGGLIQRGDERGPGTNLTLMSYNILTDKFCNSVTFPEIEPVFLSQESRFHALQKEIQGFACDIVCFQESKMVAWEVLKDFMKKQGYDGIQQQRETQIPLAIFYKIESVQLSWHEERSRALLCEFRNMKDLDRVIYVINVHLEGAPGREASKKRVSQLHHALHRLEHRLEVSGVEHTSLARVIIMGDFNSNIDDPPCQFLEQGSLEASQEATKHIHRDSDGHETNQIGHPFSLQEAYVACNIHPEFTHIRNKMGSRVDFAWVTPDTVTVRNVLNPLPQRFTWHSLRDTGSPNDLLCSDHLPIGIHVSY